MGEKVCKVRGQDHRGYPKAVLVEARTLFEAAARGLEALDKDGGQLSEVEITMHEPGTHFRVRPEQLVKWLRRYDRNDNIGVHALKRRVLELLERSAK